MDCLTRVGVPLLAALILIGASPLNKVARTDPYSILERARTYWESARYPEQLSYVVAVHVNIHGVPNNAHYHAYYDSITNEVRVNGISHEALDNPYTPRGIKTELHLFAGTIPLSTAEYSADYLGVPVLAPNYSFGIAKYVPPTQINSQELVREIRREYNDPGPSQGPEPTSSGLKVIASVAASHYVITLQGRDPIDVHQDYHLLLRPIRDPGRYRLREAWIDTTTFATDKLITQGNFVEGPGTAVPWTITFTQIDGCPYIATERTQASLAVGRRPYENVRRYDKVSLSFEYLKAASIPSFAKFYDFSSAPLTEPSS